MATLRLRIATLPPLVPLKALFLVAASSRTIGDLKAQLVHNLGQLRGVAPAELLLEVDGWELLDGSQVELVREGDVISVKLQAGALALEQPPAAGAVATPAVEPAVCGEEKKRKRSPPVPVPTPAAFVASSSTVEPVSAAGAGPAGRRPSKKAKHSAKASVAPPVVTPALATSSVGVNMSLPSAPATPAAVTRVKPAGRAPSSSESDSNSDSDSSASSSDDSSSGSSSSSSSSSTSSSGSSAPSVKSSRKPAPGKDASRAAVPRTGTTIRLTPIIPSQPPVPPGSGSNATRERNLRRRAKKKALRAAGGASAGSPAPSSVATTGAKATPPPVATPSQPADTDLKALEASISAEQPPPAFLPTQRDQVALTAADVAAARLSQPAVTELAIPFTTSANRNKSKAFKKAAMGGLSGFRTVFDSPSGSETPSELETVAVASPAAPRRPETPISTRTSQPSGSGSLYAAVAPPASYATPTSNLASARKAKRGRPSVASQQPATPRPHLSAPSDRPPSSLPPGMFVSSVDVEDPVWEASVGGGVWAAYLGLEESKVKEQVWEKGAMALDYGADEPAAPAQTVAAPKAAAMPVSTPVPAAPIASLAPKDEADWAALEAAFATAGPLAWEAVRVGSEVLFIELILDPTTYSPSLALHHGKVVAVSASSATVQVRAHYAEEAFDEDEDDGEGDGQKRGPESVDWEERVVSRADWARSDWRAVAPSRRT